MTVCSWLPQYEPARAKAIKGEKLERLWEDPGERVAEEKLNGWRFLMLFGGALPRVYMTGRRYSSRTGLLSEKGECAPCLWPYSDAGQLGITVLDGEVMPPDGASFHDMASIMNVDPDDAAETIRRIGQPTYRVFDILYNDAVDVRELSLLERQHELRELMPILGNPLIRQVPTIPATREAYEEIVARGGEGVILKDVSAAYGESGAWLKVKRHHTLDVVITGFTEAREGKTGKFLGQIGAVVVSVYLSTGQLVEVGQVSGMDDATRRLLTDRGAEYVGTVCEVVAQEWGRERLLHPRFKRHRPDANPRQATYDKMMEDLGIRGKPEVSVKGPQGELF